MRRWPMIVLATAVLAACGSSNKSAPLTTPTTAQSNTTAVPSTTVAPTTTTTAIDTSTTVPSTYVIQKGDKLSLIAKKFGLTVEELVIANHLKNPDKILYGQTLIIPKPGTIVTTTTTQPPITPPTSAGHPTTSKA